MGQASEKARPILVEHWTHGGCMQSIASFLFDRCLGGRTAVVAALETAMRGS
jgi:hypothetical protein